MHTISTAFSMSLRVRYFMRMGLTIPPSIQILVYDNQTETTVRTI